MNVSLLNRFQGCLYGSFLTPQTQDSDAIAVRNSILTEIINTLGHSGNIALEKWQNLAQTNPREFPVALIPTALFRHDYLTGFQDELGILSENQLISPDDALALLGWGQVLSSIVREKFPSQNKVEVCLSSLQAFTQGTVWEESLIGIKRAIQEGYSLERVVETLGSSDFSSVIALSLYFFLDTPEHFDLTLKRAALIKHPLVLPFTGALAGAYHGFTGIPVAWRLTQPEPMFPEHIRQFWGQWSGVLSENALPSSTAIASPLVIQPRPNVPLISQGEYVQG
ncbi:MAG: hypothetical protein DCF12_04195 [Snowella sp.]|nr:MAG: hypothetical protein DCF12_04195 [Snowella sp.]